MKLFKGFCIIIAFFGGWFLFDIIKSMPKHYTCIVSEGKIIHMEYEPSYEYSDIRGVPPLTQKFDSIVSEKYIFTIKGICDKDSVEERIIVDINTFKKYTIGDNFKFNLK